MQWIITKMELSYIANRNHLLDSGLLLKMPLLIMAVCGFFQEIIVNSENLIHVFLRGKTNPEYVAVFVCRKTANLGMALTKARLAMPALEAAF